MVWGFFCALEHRLLLDGLLPDAGQLITCRLARGVFCLELPVDNGRTAGEDVDKDPAEHVKADEVAEQNAGGEVGAGDRSAVGDDGAVRVALIHCHPHLESPPFVGRHGEDADESVADPVEVEEAAGPAALEPIRTCAQGSG
jgi:hypothetical protein